MRRCWGAVSVGFKKFETLKCLPRKMAELKGKKVSMSQVQTFIKLAAEVV